MLLTYGQFALTITKVQRANTTGVFLLSSHLKRAVTQFFYPLHTVIFECSKHHRPVLSLHTKCWHVLLQTAQRAACSIFLTVCDTCEDFEQPRRLTMGQASAFGGSLRTLISSDSRTTFSFLSAWGWWCLLTPAPWSAPLPPPRGYMRDKQTQDWFTEKTNN